MQRIIIALISLISIFFVALKVTKKRPKDASVSAEQHLINQGVVVGREFLKTTAQALAVNLGTAYPTYDPRHWFEEDEKVYDILKTLTQSQFNIISELYFQFYAKGRSLSIDIAKNLDSKYYEQLTVK